MAPTSEPAQPEPDPAHVCRVRDGDSYIKAATRRRAFDGKFARLRPGDPRSQLVLPFEPPSLN